MLDTFVFLGFDELQLAQDEYYFIKSVQNIFESGIPQFSTGGYYVRGILLQYLTALTILFLGDGSLGYRLPCVLSGIGTVVAAYYLGRLFLSRSWSILLATLLVFSSWEIEYSRFARMYSAFQFVTVCFFVVLYKFSFCGSSKKRFIAVAVALVAVLTHEMGIFIALLLFLPIPAWLENDLRTTLLKQYKYIGMSLLILGMGFLQVSFPFRNIGVSNALPDDFIRSTKDFANWDIFEVTMAGNANFFVFAGLAKKA